MAKIPTNILKTTENLIENGPEVIEKISRGYLGMSGIGTECVRKLWLGFRFAKTEKRTSKRMMRIFARGKWEEQRVIAELKENGIDVFMRQKNGEAVEIFGLEDEPQEQLIGAYGHEKGHTDGRCIGLPEAPETEHGLEIKTMKEASYKQFKKLGVQKSHPTYYAQMQRYMHEQKLKRYLFVATNKNTEERGYERVHYDKDYALALVEKAENIIASDSPAGEKFPRSWHLCTNDYGKPCGFYEICHNDAAPAKTCRSCDHVDLALDGKWLCGLQKDKELSFDDQLKACESYRRLF